MSDSEVELIMNL